MRDESDRQRDGNKARDDETDAAFVGNKNAAAMSAMPEIAPATIEAVLPAFT